MENKLSNKQLVADYPQSKYFVVEEDEKGVRIALHYAGSNLTIATEIQANKYKLIKKN